MRRIPSFILIPLLASLLSNPLWASDFSKEARWASQLKDSLVVGEAVTLQAGAVEFFAIYTPDTGRVPRRGAVVLLHGLGAHPDWPDVINPLRQELPERGWATLSIQLPVRANDARPEEYPPLFPAANERISAAIDYLRQQGALNVAIVGHSLGAAMGAYFLAEASPGSETVRAFVGIGMGGRPDTVAYTPDNLAKIRLPVLDIYGSQDIRSVLETVEPRERAARQVQNPAYRQHKVMGADHFFRGLEDSLIKNVASWLTRYAPSTQLPNPAAPGKP